MSFCAEELELTHKHVRSLETLSHEESWEITLALKEAANQSLALLTEHRASCWRCAVLAILPHSQPATPLIA